MADGVNLHFLFFQNNPFSGTLTLIYYKKPIASNHISLLSNYGLGRTFIKSFNKNSHPNGFRRESISTCRINIYLKRLVDSKDNITEEVAAEKQAYKVVTQKVDVGGI